MSKHGALRDLVEWTLIWPILKTLENLPLPLARVESRCLAHLLRWATPGLVRVARHNLSFALADLPQAEREAIIRGVYRTLTRSLLCFARFPHLSRDNIADWIRYQGYEHFELALARGKGVLFLTAHLGNWELSALAHGLYGNPMHIVVRPLDNPRLDRLIARYRTLSGNRIIEKTDSPRRIFEALAANHAVGMLIDQNASPDNGVFVEFFGKQACASTGLTKIALRTGAAVIPGFALWDAAEGRYVLRFWPPVEMTLSGDSDADVRTNTQRMHTVLEQIIRQHPDQWLWIHRRWKTRPAGEPPLYTD
ncbi:MAG: lysophospholipid acyltransferase family protein [Acidobacteria bacterium]|nr:lysophospholipid acyltransferase family protein [Acidobacteriota bacterium]